MKKLILSAVIVLGSLSLYASNQVTPEQTKTVVTAQAEYTEVSTDAVPPAIKTALQTAYPGAKLDKAFVNEKKSINSKYRLVTKRLLFFQMSMATG